MKNSQINKAIVTADTLFAVAELSGNDIKVILVCMLYCNVDNEIAITKTLKNDIANVCKMSLSSIGASLTRLVELNLLCRVEQGKYKITGKGLKQY